MTTSGDPINRIAQLSDSRVAQLRSRTRKNNRRIVPRGYVVQDPANFDRSKFVAADNLHLAFQELVESGGHGAGIDGLGPEEFSDHELRPILRKLSTTLLNGTYRPYPVRPVKVAKSSGKFRTLSLQRFTDRVVAKALLNCLAPFWQRRSVMLSTWTIYAKLDREIRRRQSFVLAIDDVRDCFPTADVNLAMQWQRHHISSEDLINLIDAVVRGHDGPDKLIGLDQGSPYSPVMMDVLLHHVLDAELDARLGNTPQFRYVDNLTYLCRDVNEGTRILAEAGQLLAHAGFHLKSEDGEPKDLRDAGLNRKVLGLIPRWSDGQLTFSIPEKAYDDLEQGLRAANEASRPYHSAALRCRGWLQAFGPALRKAVEQEVVDRVIDMALHAGFRNITTRDLLWVTQASRDSWHQVLRNTQ